MPTFRVHWYDPDGNENGSTDVLAACPVEARDSFFEQYKGLRLLRVTKIKLVRDE